MTHPEITSPFKFLDPYSREDKEIFFGRKDEVERLYQYINKNRIVLVYGTSGTGKTSLVQCGLANRLEATDWVPFFIRRGKDLNISLYEAVLNSRPLKESKPVAGEEWPLIKALDKINTYYLRPVYLIFDQFEELLILGDEPEKRAFADNLLSILRSEDARSCNLLFIMREEYFAALDYFEQSIPGFSDRRLRVETMRAANVVEVIQKSCTKFHITLEDPLHNANQIVEILKEKTGISLPYLQVYLDQLWKEDYWRTYPEGIDEPQPALEFTTEEISQFGEIKDVLERFLSQRKTAIQQKLAGEFSGIPENFTTGVLDAFVTDEGTKLPIDYTRKEEKIYLTNAPGYLQTLPEQPLAYALKELENSRILRTDGDNIELAHDVLATLIEQQRSDEQRSRNEVRRSIRHGYENFPTLQEYLTSKQIAKYDDVVDQLGLGEKYIQFFEDSKQYRRKEENERLAEAEERVIQERSLREQADKARTAAQINARTAWTGSLIALVLAIVCVLLLDFFYHSRNQVKDLTAQKVAGFRQLASKALLTDAKRLFDADDYDLDASFLLTEFVSKYIDSGSEDAVNLLMKLYQRSYHIDYGIMGTYHNSLLPRNYSNLDIFSTGDIKKIKLSKNASELMVYSEDEKSGLHEIRVFDIQSLKMINKVTIPLAKIDEISIFPEHNMFFTLQEADNPNGYAVNENTDYILKAWNYKNCDLLDSLSITGKFVYSGFHYNTIKYNGTTGMLFIPYANLFLQYQNGKLTTRGKSALELDFGSVYEKKAEVLLTNDKDIAIFLKKGEREGLDTILYIYDIPHHKVEATEIFKGLTFEYFPESGNQFFLTRSDTTFLYNYTHAALSSKKVLSKSKYLLAVDTDNCSITFPYLSDKHFANIQYGPQEPNDGSQIPYVVIDDIPNTFFDYIQKQHTLEYKNNCLALVSGRHSIKISYSNFVYKFHNVEGSISYKPLTPDTSKETLLPYNISIKNDWVEINHGIRFPFKRISNYNISNASNNKLLIVIYDVNKVAIIDIKDQKIIYSHSYLRPLQNCGFLWDEETGKTLSFIVQSADDYFFYDMNTNELQYTFSDKDIQATGNRLYSYRIDSTEEKDNHSSITLFNRQTNRAFHTFKNYDNDYNKLLLSHDDKALIIAKSKPLVFSGYDDFKLIDFDLYYPDPAVLTNAIRTNNPEIKSLSLETIKKYQLDEFLDLSDRFGYFLQTAHEADLYVFCLYYFYQSQESEKEKRPVYLGKAKHIINLLLKKNAKDERYTELNQQLLSRASIAK